MHVPSSPQSRSLWQALLVATLLEFTTTTATAHTKNHSDCAIVHRPVVCSTRRQQQRNAVLLMKLHLHPLVSLADGKSSW
jgi:hypothetical protein